MKRILTALAALALLGAAGDHDTDGRYFAGTWRCADTAWTFAPLQTESGWTRIVYGDPQHPAGTAVMGWVEGLHAWVYRDFHADGSYADLTSPGPVAGRWVWTGPYYPAPGGAPLKGRITYAEVSPTRYDRTFEAERDGALVKMGGDTCTKPSG